MSTIGDGSLIGGKSGNHFAIIKTVASEAKSLDLRSDVGGLDS